MGRGLPTNVVDIPILPLDQHSPVTEGPVGRLRNLINTQIRQFQRQGEGNTRYQVSKRSGFDSLPKTTIDIDGNTLGVLPTSGEQCFFGTTDGLVLIAQNRMYRNVGNNWVQSEHAAWGNDYVFPHRMRSVDLYAADSQIQAPDSALAGTTSLTAWREVSETTNSTDEATVTPSITALDGVRAIFRNETTGAVIRGPFTQKTSTEVYAKVRVKSDGTNLWLFQDIPGTDTKWRVVVYDQTGATLATTVINPSLGDIPGWDVAYLGAAGMVLAIPTGTTTVKFVSINYPVMGTFAITTTTDTTIACAGQYVSWLTNDVNVTEGYLVSLDIAMDTTQQLIPYRIPASTLIQNKQYATVASGISATTTWISGIAGYRRAGTNPDILVSYTLMNIEAVPEADTYGTGADDGVNISADNLHTDQQLNTTVTRVVTFAGAVIPISVRLAMSLTSRAFKIGTDYVCVGYYPARKFGPLTDVRGPDAASGIAQEPHFPARPIDPSNFQPTWFLLPLDSAQPFAGRWEYGLASSDYQVISIDEEDAVHIKATNRCLSSPFVLSTGAIRISLGYRASVVSERGTTTTVLSNFGQVTRPISFNGGSVFTQNLEPGTIITNTAIIADNSIGVRQFSFGPDYGRPFQIPGKHGTVIPGLMAGLLAGGQFYEHGLMGIETASIVTGSPASAISAFGTYLYRECLEHTSPSGDTARSVPNAPFSFTVDPDEENINDVNGHNVSMTLRQFAKIAIYRTSITDQDLDRENGVPSVAYFKITDDLAPLYNAPGTSGWAFFDNLEDFTQGNGETLYTNLGLLPRMPPPAHHGGCIWQNRVWLMGYDGAIWFSGELNEGEEPWFNIGFRIPVDGDVVSLAPMDQALVILCAGSIQYIPETVLPDGTGNPANIPVPIRLPFESGCTGFSAVIRPGVAYSSTTGGIWLLSRQFTNLWIGESAFDYLQLAGTPINGIEVDAENRLLVGNGLYVTVLDTIASAWMRWDPFTSPRLIAFDAKARQPAYVGGGLVWRLNPSINYDRDNSAVANHHVQMYIEISPVHIGNVRGWKTTWAIQFQGNRVSDCYFNALLFYNDSGTGANSAYVQRQNPSDGGLMEIEINPIIEDTTSYDLVVYDTLTATGQPTLSVGPGFSLDILSFEIGMNQGLTKMPARNRVSGSQP